MAMVADEEERRDEECRAVADWMNFKLCKLALSVIPKEACWLPLRNGKNMRKRLLRFGL
jgi:hypothetical protein